MADWPRCCICHRELRTDEQDRQACRLCEATIGQHLADLPGLYRELDDHLAPAAGPRQYTTGGPVEAPLPLHLEALSLQAAGGIATVLVTWVADWCDHLGWTMPAMPARSRAQLAEAAAFLRRNLPWAAEQHPAVDDFAAEVRQLHDAVQRITAPVEPPHIVGRHPADPGAVEACGGLLEMRPGGTTVRCTRCTAAWGPLEWLALRRAIEAPANLTGHPAAA
ncbi:hypothetical protein [Kitasatospora purpeofusca]|uniref:hypothetical protein n=1 Tax=Kitasatospora purpeofusca TaxID=67352 RepID=UPI003819CD42